MKRIQQATSRATAGAAAIASLIALLAACQTPRAASPVSAHAPDSAASASQALNDELARVAALARDVRAPAGDYRVGPGDVLEIDVFEASELSRTVRVRPDGTISLPLLGRLAVGGQTTNELEQALESTLGAQYLRNPDVSVFVNEYRAHPVTVLGEVNKPGVFYLREPRTLVEMLSDAGGVTEDAGGVVHVRRQTRNPEPGRPEFELLTIELHAHLANGNAGPDLAIEDEDTIYVPKGGVVFVEGAVRSPGVYPLRGGGSVLKAVTMAGGLAFQASRSKVQLIRQRGGAAEVVRIDLARITSAPETDVSVQDGDVVVVGSNLVKVGLHGLWRGISGLITVSTAF